MAHLTFPRDSSAYKPLTTGRQTDNALGPAGDMASFTPLLVCLMAVVMACYGAAKPGPATDLKAEGSYGLGYGLGYGAYGGVYPGWWGGYGYPYRNGWGYPGYGFGGHGGYFGGYPYY